MIQITNYHDKPKIGYSKMLLLNNFHLKRGESQLAIIVLKLLGDMNYELYWLLYLWCYEVRTYYFLHCFSFHLRIVIICTVVGII